MRVLIDTNVYINFLLRSTSEKPPATVVRAGLDGRYTIIASELLFNEIRHKCETKPYLASRIDEVEVGELVDLIRSLTEIMGIMDQPIPVISRDRADDFHLVHAVLGRADYLVSGDPDLLVLGEFEGVRIVSPAEFVRIMGL